MNLTALNVTHSILLIGHRGAGKTTLGRLLAERIGLPYYDVDEIIAQRTGKTPDRLIAENEDTFRLRENEVLAELAQNSSPSVLAVGGGVRRIPLGVFVIFIEREGWQEAALSQRTRLRPDLSAEEEIRWMIESREPHYSRHAHYRLYLEHGCGVEQALERLTLIADWLLEASNSDGYRKTWIVAQNDDDTDRCIADADLFGLAGVEIRSDTVSVTPSTGARWLASLRTPDAEFFQRHTNATAFDCDAALIEHAYLAGLAPRTLIVSHHPKDVDQPFFEDMIDAGKRLVERHPDWESFVEYKYAPVVKSWIELRYAFELCRVFIKKGGRVSFFPQGKRWKWMRAFRLRELNRWNYVRSGSHDDAAGPPSLSYFLPMAVGPKPEKYCGVIGDPVDRSIGDVWHRAASLRLDEGKIGYLKIHVPVEESDEALYFLMKINLHGLSVTSPLKCEVIHSHFVTSPDGRACGNTLTFRGGGWSLTDTDHAGMRACLDELVRNGVAPGRTLVFGKGGVSPAIVRALEETSWTPVEHVSAREGFRASNASSFQLIVNASGKSMTDETLASKAWIDLRYRDVRNSHSGLHVGGMRFYEAQAMAQRAEWGFPTGEKN